MLAEDETTAFLLCLFCVARVEVGGGKLSQAWNWDGSWKAARGDSPHMLHCKKKDHTLEAGC